MIKTIFKISLLFTLGCEEGGQLMSEAGADTQVDIQAVCKAVPIAHTPPEVNTYPCAYLVPDTMPCSNFIVTVGGRNLTPTDYTFSCAAHQLAIKDCPSAEVVVHTCPM